MSIQLPSGIVHLPNKEDVTLNLCGCAFTRDNPQVDEANECDCLKCLIIAEEIAVAKLRTRLKANWKKQHP